ncbi:uncharacterized protein LOC144907666 [Branchiostoma floridae x Branchiostoma belcheri]
MVSGTGGEGRESCLPRPQQSFHAWPALWGEGHHNERTALSRLLTCYCEPPITEWHLTCLKGMPGVKCDFCFWTGVDASEPYDSDELPDLEEPAVSDLPMGKANVTQLEITEADEFMDITSPRRKRRQKKVTVDRASGADIISSLLDMGFTKKEANKAAKEVTVTTIEEAVDWLEANMADPANVTQTEIVDITSPAPRKRRKTVTTDIADDIAPEVESTFGPSHAAKAAKKSKSKKDAEDTFTSKQRKPFLLCFKPKLVRVCRGCTQKFGTLTPPANVVISHYGNFPYYNKMRKTMVDKWSVGYFHANEGCIKPRYPDFDPEEVIVDPTTLEGLTQAHVDYCRQHGIPLPLGALQC